VTAKLCNLSDFLTLLKGVKQMRDGQYLALCPGHHDTEPSLSIREADGKILVKCFSGCELIDILKPLGLEAKELFLNSRKTKPEHREIEAVHRYTDANGKPFEVVRFRPKAFAQRRPDGKGGYVWNLNGIVPTLYHEDNLKKAKENAEHIYVVEGEKDADRLWGFGLVATTNPMGAGKWRPEYSNTLANAEVIILPDKDQAGRNHAADVAASLYSKAKSLKVVELPGPGKDVSEWLDQGGDVGQLEDLITKAPLYELPTAKLGMIPLAAWRQRITKEPESDDLIKDILPNASTEYMLVCGRSGIGKTNLVLYLGFCLATGKPFFSHKTMQCTVGYLGFEGTPRKLLHRFDKLQEYFGDPGDYFQVSRPLPFKLLKDTTDKFIAFSRNLEVIIIDPIRYIIPSDYTKPEAASAFISTLKECCQQTKTIPILVHHVRKPDRRLTVKPEDLAYEVKGATDYVDAAATVLLLERARQPRTKDGRFGCNVDDRSLHFCKVKDAPAELFPLALRFNRDTLIYEPMKYENDDNDF